MLKSLNSMIKSIEYLLFKKGLNKSDLGRIMGSSPQKLANYIGGKHTPGIDKIESIANALDVPTFYLLMSPEEQAQWDSMQAQFRPINRLLDLIDRLPPERMEMAVAALDALVKVPLAKDPAHKKKA